MVDMAAVRGEVAQGRRCWSCGWELVPAPAMIYRAALAYGPSSADPRLSTSLHFTLYRHSPHIDLQID